MSDPDENDTGTGCPPQLVKYFKMDEEKKYYKCRLCNESQTRRGKIAVTSSKSNFYRHMRDTHPDECMTEQERNEKFGEMCATAFANNLLPFNLMNNPDFRELFQFLDSTIKLPTRRTLSAKYLPQVMKKKLYHIIAAAKGCPVAITSDGWSTSTGGVHLISITLHYIDNTWTFKEAVLATKPVHGSQTAMTMADMIQKEISNAELTVHCCVTDGAPVMPAMCRHLDIENLWCLVHVIQLSVRKVDSDPTVKALYAKMNSLAGNFHRSSPNREKLGEYLKANKFEEQLSVPRSCPTRWNSDYLQLKRVSLYADTINQMLKDGIKLNITEFTADEKKLMKVLLVVLQYPFSASAQLCASASVISDAIVVALRMQERVKFMTERDSSTTVRHFCSIFKCDLDGRLKETIHKDWKYKCAVFIDPRYFLLEGVFDSVDKVKDSEWWKEVEELFMDRYGSTDGDESGSEVGSLISHLSLDDREESGTMAHRSEGMDRSTFTGSLLDDLRIPQTSTTRITSNDGNAFKEEVLCYKKIIQKNPRVTGTDGHLTFWRKYSAMLPILSKVARELLSIPASSVLSERTFSIATRLWRDTTRGNLYDEKGAMCVLMGANKDSEIRPRNVKKIAVRPIHSLEEYSSEEEAEMGAMSDGESDEESYLIREAMKKSMDEARQRQKEIDEEIAADLASAVTSRSKRGHSTSKKSTNAKKAKK